MILPRVVRSGVMPKRVCAPPYSARKPVITSSMMSSAPCVSHRARSALRKPSSGSTRPMFPAMGSTMIAAMSLPYRWKMSSTARTSL